MHHGHPFWLDDSGSFCYRGGILHAGGLAVDELAALQAMAARLGARARFGLRVNPDVEAGFHPYLQTGHDEAKFGLPASTAVELYRRVAAGGYPNLDPVAVHVHVGSQLAGPGELAAGARIALGVLEEGRRLGLPLDRVDVGGGLPVSYDGGSVPSPKEFAAALVPLLAPGDLVAVLDAGAYGMVMASNYNGQPRPAEVVVTGGQALITRRRETWEDLLVWEAGPARRLAVDASPTSASRAPSTAHQARRSNWRIGRRGA